MEDTQNIEQAEDIGGTKLTVPTYNGKWLKDPSGNLPEFDEPTVPVLVCPADGVRIVLGTHNYRDYSKPDVQIERRHNGWVIFLHPLGGSDPSACVFFLDGGRSFFVKEYGGGPTPEIEVVDYEEAEEAVDLILESGLSCEPSMIVERPQSDNPR